MADPSPEPGLERRLSLPLLFFIIVADMIGVGIFTTSGFILRTLPNAWVLLGAWILGGFFALCGAWCYAELGAMFPAAGGDYVFLRESYGKPVAFLSGWVSLWVGFSAPIAAVAAAASLYFFQAWGRDAGEWGVRLLSAALILTAAGIHAMGLSQGARIHAILTLLKILLVLSLIAGGFFWGRGDWGHFGTSVSWSSFVSPPFAVCLVFITFAYSGWNASVYVGSEARNPGRNIPLSILLGVGGVLIVYVALNVLFIYAVPVPALAGVEEVGSAAASRLFGPGAGRLYAIAICVSLLSTLSALMVTGPRVYYAMARDGVFFRVFASVHPDRKVPAASIALQSAIAIFLVMTFTFEKLLLYIGFVLAIFSALTVSGLVRLRMREPMLARPYRAWGYPLTPFVFIAGNVGIAFFSFWTRQSAFVWGLATLVSGAAAYLFFTRKAPP